MKVSMGFGEEYESKYEWGCFCQGGSSGLVLPKGSFDKVFGEDPLSGLAEGMASEECYTTAFFEAFPKNPSCFLRGEGKTIEEAEESCWQKYQKVLTCNHEMERRGRTDGYAYCKHCSYSATVFEPLTKCCKCGKPTAYTQDYKGNWYCEKHKHAKLKNPNPSYMEKSMEHKRLPRKYKKLLKNCAVAKFEEGGHFGEVKFGYRSFVKFTCDGYQLSLMGKRNERNLIKNYKNKI